MNRETTAALVGACVVVVVLAAFAFVAGVGPLGGNSGVEDGEFPTPFGTPYGSSGDGGGGGGDGGDAGNGDGSGGSDAPTPPFQIEIESVEPCGRTCRDVTATLSNGQDRWATGVTVYIRILAGNDTDGDVVWEGSQEVGSLGPGESYTETRRVDLGFAEALAVKRHDGQVTILLVVETDRRRVGLIERRDVT